MSSGLFKADVIVNVCDSYPTKRGRLSTDIIRAGNIMQEWTNLGSLEFGEVKSTGAGKGSLRSKCVYHVIGPSKECDFVTVRHNMCTLFFVDI
ncbi:hypothetical protein DPMN_000601 [Dreissena polymorpha]|uniref:Macro domain-containing protein n=1 Tax=Dreissena polymorpha TaxID=45954 RepID=A0A9D4RPM6_DREPO|nr:hypothetical protein DPMN_000601 [Dreissena polymorpha]